MSNMVINEEFLAQLEVLQMHIKDNVAGLFGGNHQSRTHGSSCEFDDYRDYSAGDDISKIDWNAYARFDKLYLKLYLDERRLHTRIYIDASRSMVHGSTEKAEQALRMAAALAYLSICQLDKVSIYIVRDKTTSALIENISGKESFIRVVGALNEIEFSGDCCISDAILPEKVGYGDGMSVIISDFLTEANYEDAIEYFVAKKRHVLCVQVLSSEELSPVIRGKVHFFDSEDMEKYYRKNIDRDIMKAYRDALQYVIDTTRDFCLERGADYLLCPANISLGELFFGNLMDAGVVK